MKKTTLSVTAVLILIWQVGQAQEEAPKPSREECTMACDEQSDACMGEAEGDQNKAKACDDAYAECLARCG